MRRHAILLAMLATILSSGWSGMACAADGLAIGVTLTIHTDAAPQVALLPSTPATWTEGDAPVAVAAAGTLSDADSTALTGGELVVSLAPADPADRLAIAHQGEAAGEIGYDSGTGAIRFGGSPVGTASGGSGDALRIAFTTAAATPAAAQAVLRRIVFSCAGDNPTAGTRTIAAEAADGDGNRGSASTRLLGVVAVDDPPVVSPLTVVAVAGQTITAQVTGSDPEGSALTWSIASPPASGSASIDAASGLLSYTAAGSAGTVTLVVRATAGGQDGQATVTLRVSGPGATDRLWVVSDPPLEAQAGSLLSFVVQVDDAGIAGGATDLRFRLLDPPAGMTLVADAPGRRATVQWTAASGPEPHRRFAVLAWDETTGAADLLQAVVRIHPLPGGSN